MKTKCTEATATTQTAMATGLNLFVQENVPFLVMLVTAPISAADI